MPLDKDICATIRAMFYEWVVQYANVAPWIVLGSILLAGLYVPISIDVILVTSALLAGHVIPEKTWHLFAALSIGCYFSAWLAYWLGRIAGPKLIHFKWYRRILPEARKEKIHLFYKKHGFLTLFVGRFIPFGVRNCIYTTAGMTKTSFAKFALWDLVACSVWCSSFFFLFYSIGKHYNHLSHFANMINICIFSGFVIAVIGVIWYKRKRANV